MNNNWQQESGDWRGLSVPEQRQRYAAIAAHLNQRDVTAVLDVGCGEAALYDWLMKHINYTGVEQSALAAQSANARCGGAVIHSTAEAFDIPGVYWHRIIFNEVLYYLADPIELLRKYARRLTPDGTIIISIYKKPGPVQFKRRFRHWLDRRRPMSNAHCLEMVKRFLSANKWTTLTDQQIFNPDAETYWQILAVRPPAAACHGEDRASAAARPVVRDSRCLSRSG